jgi:hypothetical protein
VFLAEENQNGSAARRGRCEQGEKSAANPGSPITLQRVPTSPVVENAAAITARFRAAHSGLLADAAAQKSKDDQSAQSADFLDSAVWRVDNQQ